MCTGDTGVYSCIQVCTGDIYRCTQMCRGYTGVHRCSYITYISGLDSCVFGPDFGFLDGQKVGSCYCNDCTSTGEHRETPREVGLDR